MQTAETTKRQCRTKSQKIHLLEELKSGGMTVSNLAHKHGFHPITIHKWKRQMSQETKKYSIDVHEILLELEKIKEENTNLKKAVGNLTIDNEILRRRVMF